MYSLVLTDDNEDYVFFISILLIVMQRFTCILTS